MLCACSLFSYLMLVEDGMYDGCELRYVDGLYQE